MNVASRVQGHATPGEVLVTEEAYQTVKEAFPNALPRAYTLKGISEPVVAYALT